MAEESPRNTGLRIRKCDGSIEPFHFAKLLNSIRNGLRAGGEAAETEACVACGLAEAVLEYAEQASGDTPVHSKLLSELVDLVLEHTGYGNAGTAMRRHRSFRQAERRRVMVATSRRSDGRVVHHRWNKGRIVQHLRRRHMLDAPASRMIAGRVEQLIFNCGLKVVTAGLVSEMTKSELLAWGLLPEALVVKKRRGAREPGRIKDKTDST